MSHSIDVITALQLKLVAEEELPLAYAAIQAENALYRFDERVQEGVKLWLAGELTDAFAVGDISLADIQYELGCTQFQALSVMDIYLKNPDFVPVAQWTEEKDFIATEEYDLSEMIYLEDMEDEE